MMSDFQPVVIEGVHVRLEPLSLGHVDDLAEVGLDPELWKYTTTDIRTAVDMKRYVEIALELLQQGNAIPYAIHAKGAGKAVGSTRYANIDRTHRRLEVGWTWIAKPWQRTTVNTESKYLLLNQAFELLKCIRVEFKTDALNLQSQNALVRIGATKEGVFRRHMLMPSGRHRDSVYFSMIDSEWPGIKANLEKLLLASYR